jgi:hypothetical protein
MKTCIRIFSMMFISLALSSPATMATGGIMPMYQDEGELCSGMSLPVLAFADGSVTLSASTLSALDRVSGEMRNNPACKVIVRGNGNGNKVDQQLSYNRVENVINYMVVNKGVDRERFVFEYGLEGNPLSVELIPAEEDARAGFVPPPPYPGLKR